MKRLLIMLAGATLLTAAAAQSLDFEVQVQGITALVVDDQFDGAPIEPLTVTYQLENSEDLVYGGQSTFRLRYITNKVHEEAATFEMDECTATGGDNYECVDWVSEPAGQFKSAYISIAAGAPQESGVSGISAFANVLELRISAETCSDAITANSFEAENGGSYDGYWVFKPGEGTDTPLHWVDGAGLTPLEMNRLEASVGESQAAGNGFVLAFDGEPVPLVGNPDDEEESDAIRGAACGAESGDGLGMTVTVQPEINTEVLLPEGITAARIVVTIHELDD